jgi:four helix bundle protein
MAEQTRPRVTKQSFHDLQIWQKAMDLTVAVYRLTKSFPREESFGLTSQLRRSAISIPSNIAEGHGRMNPREFRHFLLIARGSNSELQTQLELATALQLADPQSVKNAQNLSSDVENMLFALLSRLRNNSS